MASITLNQIVKHYGEQPVLHGIDVHIHDGEFVALVGPSGCGKSTLLRAIAGLEPISGGEIRLGERVLNDVAPRDRNIAMVFQNYALYPHMTVAQNLGFALRLQGVGKAQIARRVQEVADVLGLAPLLGRHPRQLSGGQRQRVAMGRAIVRRPEAFLFDEPLSNLDAKLRVQMRTEIKALHQRLGTTTVYVTHDQVEAMTMADRIVVLKDGRVEQVGAPLALYDRPRNAFVAGFIGSPAMNLLPGQLALDGAPRVRTDDGLSLPLPASAAPAGAVHGQRVLYGARPEHWQLAAAHEGLPAEVIVVEPTGAETQVALRVGRHDVLAAFRDRVGLRSGDRLGLRPDAAQAHLFDAASGARLN
ncbi:sn-glycerol-3-phosphate ABC transporter ATP-binding protein UgpC [Xenophilus arseniciresistens]|uniref:Sn-glycerol-3-phosphate ABC transporter ATP-binding protein UgpC n=1 Tax=Xenophilus arseniciresistens TaxID=1283306 RepID=A0AAE3NB75_9BURK|nr:sn-glycerol-3-phosphate ABC transporter ATP-binding protein UgpC [Xenophilus arseniciresistens]MDA7418308.1 sn-glycerol-3-phosphate ABC transporter ATP-binding protein UgpC [Xenophilus arseniciresistens]